MTAEVKKDQVTFMQKIACPTFKELHEITPSAQIWYARCLANTERWEPSPQLCVHTAQKVWRESMMPDLLFMFLDTLHPRA